MKNSYIHILKPAILIFLISMLYSCEVDLSDSVQSFKSKLWINAIIGVNDTVRIYVGNTSGLNSGDKTQYRNDAVVELKVNSGLFKKLKYVVDAKSPYKGYYFTRRLENSAEGDTLNFKSWIPGMEFDTVKGSTYIPQIPHVSDPVINRTTIDGYFVIDLDLKLADTLVGKKYFEIKLKKLNFSDIDSELPSGVESITLLNDLKLSYGQMWNEKLKSILIDYQGLDDDNLHIRFRIKNNYSRIKLGFELKKTTKEYFDYFMALDGGSIVNSNIENGAGIFAGYSKYNKNIIIK